MIHVRVELKSAVELRLRYIRLVLGAVVTRL